MVVSRYIAGIYSAIRNNIPSVRAILLITTISLPSVPYCFLFLLQTSNLVLQADRSLLQKRDKDEATGEVQTLSGRLVGVKMGDRAQRNRPPTWDEKEKPATSVKEQFVSLLFLLPSPPSIPSTTFHSPSLSLNVCREPMIVQLL